MEGFGEAIKIMCVLCVLTGAVVVGLFWYFVPEKKEPTALDVYRGETELVVTSVNGVPTDSVVVFKK